MSPRSPSSDAQPAPLHPSSSLKAPGLSRGSSSTTRDLAGWFELPVVEPTTDPAPPPDLSLPDAGQILLLTGPSGGGKSTALRGLTRQAIHGPRPRIVLDVNQVRLRHVPCAEQFGKNVPFALDLMARVGLAEARTFLCLPHQLSDGQRWRLRLAVTIARMMALHGRSMSRRRPHHPHHRPHGVLVADEFCALLDRVTAAVVARSLRRTIERLARVGVQVSAIVATSHDDLLPALLPDRVVRCDFEEFSETKPQSPLSATACPEAQRRASRARSA